jgi:hypothetical protein
LSFGFEVFVGETLVEVKGGIVGDGFIIAVGEL